MGVYLSSPKTEKCSEDGENDRLRYGVSSMQGWRATMEDAHAAHLDLDFSTSFFGVYDGHGGALESIGKDPGVVMGYVFNTPIFVMDTFVTTALAVS